MLGENSFDDEGESPFATGDLLELDDAMKRVPARSKALMKELFRAELSRVQRLNPKDLL
tara:strand:- start:163 stop:339 length:177 start_codon:yes stop_codon:yes gene_type:complete